MITLQVRITVTPVPAGFAFNGRGLIDSTDQFLRKTCNGSCVGVVTDGQITFELRADSAAEITSMMESYCDRFRKEGRQVQIVVIEDPKVPLSQEERAIAAQLSVSPQKLTKSFFMKQATGAFLASNVMRADFSPVFAEPIASVDARAAQWERIRSVGVDQRACYVFPSEAHYRQWQEQALESFRAKSR